MAQATFTEEELADDLPLPDDVDPEPHTIKLFRLLDEGNLVEMLDDLPGGNRQVASDTLQLLETAKDSMAKWKKRYEQALKLSKLESEEEKKTFPFEDASMVMMPFITEAMLDFHSRTVPELVWAKNVVGIRPYGTPNDQKEARAERVSMYLNHQVSEVIKCWRPEQDKMLLALPCVGTAYKKTYYNGDEQRAASDLLFADEVVFNHDYPTFDEAPDKFIEEEYTRNEILMYIRGSEQWKIDENTLEEQRDHPEPFDFVRGYTWIDMDEDGLTEPYEVVIRCDTEEVVSVYPAYDEEGITDNEDGEIVKVEMMEIFTQYRFLPDPEGGPMGVGWGILLGDLFVAINTTMRQMIDAGTLANLAGNSGLIDAQMTGGSGRGNRQHAGPIEVRMGELTPISTGGKPLGQSIVQFPYNGPNPTLMQLTEYMIEQARTMTNSALNMDTNSQEAAAMYLARLQQGLKIPNSIVMRVYESARQEFKKLALINYKHYNDEQYNRVLDDPQPASMQRDFNPEDCDISLAVDPSQGSDLERQQRANMILAEAKEQQSQVLNVRAAYVNWLDTLKTPNIEELAPEPSGEPDPMEQLMMANLQRQAELEERQMVINEAKQDLDRMKTMMEASRDGAKFGMELDKSEAEITRTYAEAFAKLWEMGMPGDDMISTVQNIERRLIDKKAGLPAPMPLASPDPNPQQNQAVTPQ